MPYAYLVFGPEGSATRLTTRILISSGCQGGGDNWQPWDMEGDWHWFKPPEDKSLSLVWRRSFPHDGHWCNPRRLCRIVEGAGWMPYVVVCVRHGQAIARSRVDRFHHAANVGFEYERILQPILGTEVPWVFAVYESFVLGGKPAVDEFTRSLGLPGTSDLEHINDENEKYWVDA